MRGKIKAGWCLPKTFVGERAVAEVGGVVQADEALRAAGAGEGGQEAGGLTPVALPLVVRHQLKHLLLRGQHPLQDTQHHHTEKAENGMSD